MNATDQTNPPLNADEDAGHWADAIGNLVDVGSALPVDAGFGRDGAGGPDAGTPDAGSSDVGPSDTDSSDEGSSDTIETAPEDTTPDDVGADVEPDADPDSDTDQRPNETPDDDDDADDGDDSASSPDPDPQPEPTAPDFLNESDTRAMWLWADAETADAFVSNRWGMQDELMQLAAAPHGQASRSLNRIFFEVRTYSRTDIYDRLRPITYDPLLEPTEQEKLRAFNKRAHAQGIAVEYLDGQAIWLASDANTQWPKQVCEDVVTFNMTTNDVEERLDGVHYDIEPHTVHTGPWAGQWWENKLTDGYNADWTQRFKDIMNSCRTTFDDYEDQTGHHLTLSVDLGTDYAYYNKPLLNFFNGHNSPVDYITLMNYYDNRPNQNGDPSFFHGWNDGYAVTGGVIQNLNLWSNVPVLFGLETGPTGIAADYMSFYQEGHNAMYSVVDELTRDYSGPGMLGVAFHPWGSFKDLEP